MNYATKKKANPTLVFECRKHNPKEKHMEKKVQLKQDVGKSIFMGEK